EAGYGDARDHAMRVRSWIARQPDGEPRREAQALQIHLEGLLGDLRVLPEVSTLADFSEKLFFLCERLQLFARARGFRTAGEHGVLEEKAIARDQAAVREFELLLTDFPRAAARVGLSRREISRQRFLRLLSEQLSTNRPKEGGIRGAAVQ